MKHIVYIGLLSLLIGCASSGKKSSYKNLSYRVVDASSAARGKCEFQADFDLKTAINKAATCFAEKNYPTTHLLAVHIRSLDEKAPWGYYFDSLYFASKEHHNQALWYAKKALERDYKNALLHFQLGRVYYSLNDLNLAIYHLGEAHKLDKDMEEATFFLAQTYLQNQMFELAYKHYTKLSLSNNKQDVLRGRYLSAFKSGNYVEAFANIKRIGKRHFHNSDYVHLAYLQEKVGQIDEALDTYKYVLKSKKWQNTTYTKLEIADKIKDLEVQLRAIATAKGEKEIK